MNGVSFTPASIEDIGDIWDYTATMWGIDQADYYINNIRDCCSDLASGRKRGRTVPVRSGYLKYAVGKHLIFFLKTEDGILVVRILHQSMDVEIHM